MNAGLNKKYILYTNYLKMKKKKKKKKKKKRKGIIRPRFYLLVWLH